MTINQNTKPGTLVKFCPFAPSEMLSYSITEDRKRVRGKWHEFSAIAAGIFISESAEHPKMCGIVLVDDKLLYVNYEEIAELKV